MRFLREKKMLDKGNNRAHPNRASHATSIFTRQKFSGSTPADGPRNGLSGQKGHSSLVRFGIWGRGAFCPRGKLKDQGYAASKWSFSGDADFASCGPPTARFRCQ